LPTHALARHLNLQIIGSRITLDGVALVINRFSRARNAGKVYSHLLISDACIHLRHGQRTVSEQPAHDLQEHILIEQAHPQGMPELVRGETVELRISVENMTLHCPFVELSRKGMLPIGTALGTGSRKQIEALFSPLISDLLLLGLDRANHFLVNQGDHVLPMGFALIATQIPLWRNDLYLAR
jgi:hypothetical protein